MSISKKHHYIPQFYLKGFTNELGEYYLFDKERNEIRKSKPINSFFENKRNTGFVKDEEFVLLEDMYAYFDGETAPHIDELRNMTKENFILKPDTLARLKLFIPQLFWRIPKNDAILDALIDNSSFKETGFDFIDKDGNSATPELQAMMKDVDLFRKIYHLLIPFLTQNEKYRNTDYDNWRVYFRGNNYQLIGDCPLITKDLKDFGSLTRNVIFPICSDKVLIHSTQPKPANMPSQFILELDLLTILQAKRFVACANENYLNILIEKYHHWFDNPEMIVEMRKSLFCHFN